MARVKRSVIKLKKRHKLLKLTKGYRGARSRRIKTAQEAMLHALHYAYRDRRQRKRDMRQLWIIRINAACRTVGLSYNRFISGLKKQGVVVNRKMLADLAIANDGTFAGLVELAKSAK